VALYRHIHVACAIIEENGLVLAAQRSEIMSLPLKWEFPGGKIEPGETARECLRRELLEEMGIAVQIDRQLPESSHQYADFTITLYPFICRKERGEITLHEHKAITWIAPDRMLALDWAEADLPLIATYRSTVLNRRDQHGLGAPRISTTIKLGTRTDRDQSMEDKIRSVEDKLAK